MIARRERWGSHMGYYDMPGMFGDNPLTILIEIGLVVMAVIVFALMTAGF